MVLCAIVGYLSNGAIKESEIRMGPAKSLSCSDILDKRPNETTHIVITDFIPGKHFATIDFDDDEKWEELCVPFFAKRQPEAKHAYRSVMICFKGIADRDAFKSLIASGEIDTNYWPMRQELDLALHSQLAQKYKNMDFANSPVFHCGFETSNPVLGETSLKLSAAVGGFAAMVAVLTFLVGLCIKLFNRKSKEPAFPELEETSNRAGLPGGGSVLDRVTSMRERQGI